MAPNQGQGRAIGLSAAILAMAAGVYGGLLRIGVPLPDAPRLTDGHGALMVCGMFGTLICLERAVALARGWAYLAPAAFALGGICIVFGTPGIAPRLLFVAGGGVFVAVSVVIFTLQRALFTAMLSVGALSLLIGNVLLFQNILVADLAGWWLAFLICTIAAERLELSRIMEASRRANVIFLAASVIFVTGAALGIFTETGGIVCGVGLLAMVAWLARYDVATRTVRMRGQPRFMAAAMLAGYGWLAATGLFLVARTGASFNYDLVLHAVFIGFVLSMVFGHALIIFPGITGAALHYSRWLYLPLALLHLSIASRVAGDILEVPAIRAASGAMTAVALLGFAVTLFVASWSRRKRRNG